MHERNGRDASEGNPYEGLLDLCKVQLIRRRARLCGFRRHELDDVLQDVVLAIGSFRYHADRANGATEQTALTGVIDRQLWAVRRKQARYRKHVAAFRDRQQPLDTRAKGVPRSGAAFPADELAIDVVELLAALPADERRACELLSQGASVAEVARQMKWGWHRVQRVIVAVRRHPRARSLGDYL